LQAALPDLNSAIIRYRTLITSCLEQKNYVGCMGGLYSLNGLLPTEYRVIVSTEEFDKLTKTNLLMICKHCSKEFKDNEVKIKDLLLPDIISCITRTKTEKVWFCPGCKMDNKLTNTIMKKEKLASYSYFHVMPEPPIRHDGLLDRREFHRNMEIWVWSFMGELEERCGKLRHDFLNREDNMIEEITDEV